MAIMDQSVESLEMNSTCLRVPTTTTTTDEDNQSHCTHQYVSVGTTTTILAAAAVSGRSSPTRRPPCYDEIDAQSKILLGIADKD